VEESLNRIVIVGATGNFGRLVSKSLVARSDTGEILVTSRHRGRAERLVRELQPDRAAVSLAAAELDANSVDSCRRAVAGAALCIDLAGPFQHRESTLVRACAEVGCDYLDFSEDAEYSGAVARVAASASIRAFTSHSTFSATTLLLAHRLVERVGNLGEVRSGLVMATGGGAGPAAMQSLLNTLDDPRIIARAEFTLTYPEPIGGRKLLVYPTADNRWFLDVLGIPRCVSGIGFTNIAVAPMLMLLRKTGIRLSILLPILLVGQSILQRLPQSGMRGCLQVWGRGNEKDGAVSLLAYENGIAVPCFPAILTGIKYLRGERPMSEPGLHWLHEWLPWSEWERFCSEWTVRLHET